MSHNLYQSNANITWQQVIDNSGRLNFRYGSGMETDPGLTTNAMSLTSTGNLGLGTTSPNYTLHVNGSAGKPGGGSWSDSSDERLKMNVQSLTGALDKLTKLQGVNFEWINPDEHGNQSGAQAGLIAQEVEKVFPEWVSEVEPSGKDKELAGEGEKVKSLQFPHGFNAYLIEAIKELKAQNETLIARNGAQEMQIEKQQAQIEELLARISALEAAK